MGAFWWYTCNWGISKQPIIVCYLGHVIGYQPIRDSISCVVYHGVMILRLNHWDFSQHAEIIVDCVGQFVSASLCCLLGEMEGVRKINSE